MTMKSVYSLVLMDSVIKAVDKQAYALGTSRSNLINQILAQHLCCVTPEMRMQEIFSTISNMTGNDLQLQQQRSKSLITLRTALEYKYRPTVNYKVELLRNPDRFMGTLRVHIRTQSLQLIELFNSFFSGWMKMENTILKNYGVTDYSCELTPGCFSRKLFNPEGDSNEQTAENIYSYILFLDKALKLYFSAPQEFPAVSSKIAKDYKLRLEDNII
jgi:hypothetical protein